MQRLALPVLAATVAALAVFVLFAISPTRWIGWNPATCMPDSCFCEAVREGPIRQPANTASGLAFLPAAAAVLTMASRRRRRAPHLPGIPLAARPIHAALYAGVTVLIGLGTAFYHASLSFWGQTADVLGMYLIATLFILFNAARLWQPDGRVVGPLYVLGNAGLLWGLIAIPQARRYVFGALVLAVIGLEFAIRSLRHAHGQPLYFRGALGALGVGLAAWTLDITHTWCNPSSYLQGHALWHLAGATALVLMALHYLYESPAPG
jgi:hypothetical protein